jgi:hypothetical protein
MFEEISSFSKFVYENNVYDVGINVELVADIVIHII